MTSPTTQILVGRVPTPNETKILNQNPIPNYTQYKITYGLAYDEFPNSVLEKSETLFIENGISVFRAFLTRLHKLWPDKKIIIRNVLPTNEVEEKIMSDVQFLDDSRRKYIKVIVSGFDDPPLLGQCHVM